MASRGSLTKLALALTPSSPNPKQVLSPFKLVVFLHLNIKYLLALILAVLCRIPVEVGGGKRVTDTGPVPVQEYASRRCKQ